MKAGNARGRRPRGGASQGLAPRAGGAGRGSPGGPPRQAPARGPWKEPESARKAYLWAWEVGRANVQITAEE